MTRFLKLHYLSQKKFQFQAETVLTSVLFYTIKADHKKRLIFPQITGSLSIS